MVLGRVVDRKSTRLNSSHGSISYAVFCLKKKKNSGTGGQRGRDDPGVAGRAVTRPHAGREPWWECGGPADRAGRGRLVFFFFFFKIRGPPGSTPFPPPRPFPS